MAHVHINFFPSAFFLVSCIFERRVAKGRSAVWRKHPKTSAFLVPGLFSECNTKATPCMKIATSHLSDPQFVQKDMDTVDTSRIFSNKRGGVMDLS